MVKIPYMEAGIVIMTDFSIVEKQKSANLGFCPSDGGRGVKLVGTKSQVRPTFFGQLPLAKQERREESLQERKERERERKGGRRRKAQFFNCYPLRGITSKQLKGKLVAVGAENFWT